MVETYTATFCTTIVGFGLLICYLVLFCMNNGGKKRIVIPPHLQMTPNNMESYHMNSNYNIDLPPPYFQSQEQERLRNLELPFRI